MNQTGAGAVDAWLGAGTLRTDSKQLEFDGRLDGGVVWWGMVRYGDNIREQSIPANLRGLELFHCSSVLRACVS
jgi:hypothetical protein